jgi:hypothetical protein
VLLGSDVTVVTEFRHPAEMISRANAKIMETIRQFFIWYQLQVYGLSVDTQKYNFTAGFSVRRPLLFSFQSPH